MKVMALSMIGKGEKGGDEGFLGFGVKEVALLFLGFGTSLDNDRREFNPVPLLDTFREARGGEVPG